MYTGLGRVHYEWNELTEATAAYAQARTWAERSGIFDILMHTLAGEVTLYSQRGDAAAAKPYLESYDTFGHHGHYQHMTYLTESVIANANLRLGKLDEAVRWANASGFMLTDQPESAQHFFYQVLVAVRLAEDRAVGTKAHIPQMLALLEHLFQQSQAGHQQRDMINNLILQALALDYQDNHTAARRALQQALDLARPGNLTRTFLDSDPALASLLAQIDDPYARRLYQTFWKELRTRGKSTTVSLDLTPREYEVLQEIIARPLQQGDRRQTVYLA